MNEFIINCHSVIAPNLKSFLAKQEGKKELKFGGYAEVTQDMTAFPGGTVVLLGLYDETCDSWYCQSKYLHEEEHVSTIHLKPL